MAMTLRPGDLNEPLRQQAAYEGRSAHAIVLDAIAQYLDRSAHNTRLNRVLDRVITEEANVLQRLGDC